jgi:hypothetical protein
MPEEFEKKIQDKLNDFKLQPSPKVWDEVAAALDENKKKRFAFWWWAALFVLLCGTATWFLLPSKNNPENKLAEAQQTGISKDSITKHDNIIVNTDTTTSKNIVVPQTKTPEEQHQNSLISAKSTASANILLPQVLSIQNQNDKNVPNTTIEKVQQSSAANNYVEKNTDTAASITNHTGDTTHETNIANNSKQAATNITTVTTASTLNKEVKKQEAEKKNKWFISVDGGLLNVNNTNNGSNKSLAASPAASSMSYFVMRVAATAPEKMEKASMGYSFGISIQRKFELSKKWWILPGIGYRFLSNNQPTGDYVVDNTAYTTLTYNTIINHDSYYKAGNSLNVQNYSNWLEVPVAIGYNINPSAKRNIQLYAGASYAYAFHNKWLLADEDSKTFYYDDAKLNKSLINVQAGALYKINSFITAGLQYQRTLTSVANNNIYPAMNYNLYSLRFLFSIKSNHHPTKK